MSRAQAARLRITNGRFISAKDLNSTNGTFVNGNQVTEIELRSGDVIELGEMQLEFIAGQTAMIVGRDHIPWICGGHRGGAGCARVSYIAYAMLSPNGPHGGSVMGLVFAFAGTGVIVFECLLGARKKYPASPMGRVRTWLRAHIWLGLLSFLLILLHSGFRWGQGLACLLMWLFAVIALSGIFGLVLQD